MDEYPTDLHSAVSGPPSESCSANLQTFRLSKLLFHILAPPKTFSRWATLYKACGKLLQPDLYVRYRCLLSSSERIVIIGVGMTAHNRQQIDKYDINNPAPYAKEYSKRIVSAIADYTGKNRETRLRQYTFHPDFRNAHPTPEHLWPLCFAVG